MVEVVGSSPIVPTSILDLSEVLEQILEKSNLHLKRSIEALSEWKRSCGFHFCFLASLRRRLHCYAVAAPVCWKRSIFGSISPHLHGFCAPHLPDKITLIRAAIFPFSPRTCVDKPPFLFPPCADDEPAHMARFLLSLYIMHYA
jgi:hypothetical protein